LNKKKCQTWSCLAGHVLMQVAPGSLCLHIFKGKIDLTMQIE